MTEEEYLQMMMAQGGSQGGLLGGGYSPPSFPSVTPEQQAMVSQSPVRTRGQGIVGAIGGLLGGLGRAVGPGLQQASRAIYGDDEITRLRRQNAFAAMTLNPNQALITSNAAQIKGLQEQDLATASAADIAEYLRGRGRHAEAALVERNPELASTVLAPEFRAGNTYAPQMDPKTGEYYVTRVTPTGEVEILKTGQFGETPETEGQRELQAQLTLQDNSHEPRRRSDGRCKYIARKCRKIHTSVKSFRKRGSERSHPSISSCVRRTNSSTKKARQFAWYRYYK